MDTKLHRLESFPAQDTQGKAYKVCGYELLARAYPWLDADAQWEPTGQVEYRLDSGEHLDMDRDGTWQVTDTGVRLHRLHAKASDTAH